MRSLLPIFCCRLCLPWNSFLNELATSSLKYRKNDLKKSTCSLFLFKTPAFFGILYLSIISINLLAFYHQRGSLIGYATHYLFYFSINLLAFYHQRRSLIGYATHYLFCFSINLLAFYHQRRSLIGYATHYLFCFSINLLAFYHQRRSLIGYATHYLFFDR